MAEKFISRLSLKRPKGSETAVAPPSITVESAEQQSEGGRRSPMLKSPSINFMHDPCTLAEPVRRSAETPTLADSNKQQQSAAGLGPPPEAMRQRKASLMPPLTEEDLRTSGMVGSCPLLENMPAFPGPQRPGECGPAVRPGLCLALLPWPFVAAP